MDAPETESQSKTIYNFTRQDVVSDEDDDVGSLSVISVIGLSTGVGATTVAINLSLGAMQFGRTCILDLQDYGNVAAQLKLSSASNSWANLNRLRPGDDKKIIGQTLILNHESGVAVMASPNQRVERRIGDGGLLYMLRVLNEGFSRLIVLLPTAPTRMSETVLKVSENIVAVVGDDPTSISAAQNSLETIEQLDVRAPLHLVLNRTRPHGMSFEEVSSTLNYPLVASIPYEQNQLDALSTGRPMIMLKPDSLYARSIIQLARQL